MRRLLPGERVISSSRMSEPRIQQQFFESADLLYEVAEGLSRPIADASQALLGCITGGGKVLACGAGTALATAQVFTAQLVGRFERERPGLAAIALGSDATVLNALLAGGAADQVLAHQVQALGAAGDVLVVIQSDAHGVGLVAAVDAAHAREMTVIALVGRAADAVSGRLVETDVCINVNHARPARVREVHLLVLHSLCDALDFQLLGEQDTA